ncbi:MAG TPA: hypothetical protein VF384_02585 [Planctomycetota bacterium]
MVAAQKLVRLYRCLVGLCLLLLIGGAPCAQEEVDIKFVHPEKFERATKTDDKGMVLWAEHAKQECPTCSGTCKTKCSTCARFSEDATNCIECKRSKEREVPCRACAGTGSFPDPLEKVHCPGCRAAGFLLCMLCGGGGRLRIDKAKQWSACPGCRGDGGFKCTVCNGDRLVACIALKPSLKDANAATLTKALEATDKMMKELDAFTPAGGDKVRKEVKAMVKIYEIAQKEHPAIKNTIKALEEFMNKTYAGTQFQGHEENEASAMKLVKESTSYYLKHQKRMMELCLKRAEANEKLAADSKPK